MKPREQVFTKNNPRIPIFYWIFAAAYLLLIGVLGYRQLFLYDYYSAREARQSMRRVIKPGARGDIYDRNGKLLVTNVARFSAVVYFNDIRLEFRREFFRLKKSMLAEIEATKSEKKIDYVELGRRARENVLNSYLAQINEILGTDYKLARKDYNRHFNEKMLLPFPLIKNLSAREHSILAERLPVDSPIQIYTDTSRYYPYGEYAAHLLGYVSSEFDDIDTSGMPGEDLRTYTYEGKMGRSGIEKAFDDILSGTSGAKIWIVDHQGFQYDNIADVKPQKGKDVVCSLDIDLQGVIEEAFGERKGAAVVMDVKSGEVLSMVSRPAYDPNDFSPFISYEVSNAVTARGAWLNRATQGLYPPGSTFKLVTACAGLMTGVIDESSQKECIGGQRIGNRIFPCNSRFGHGPLDLSGAIAKSCNVFFYQTGLEADIKSLSATARDFGLDSDPGIEVKENYWRRSNIPTPEYKRKKRPYDGPWTQGDTANTSIGQGYLLQTPMQMACFAASFARRETRTRASIIHDPARKADIRYHGAEKLSLTDVQYNAILKGMIEAVNSGTCKRAKIDTVQVAAKSGTAQVRVSGKPLTLAWMLAFAPAENPTTAMVVVVEGEEPGDVGGGRTAGPIVRAAMQKRFENISPKIGN